MLSETIATLEDRLEKPAHGDFILVLRTHARALLAAAKLSEARARACEAAKEAVVYLEADRAYPSTQHPNHAHADGVHWDGTDPPLACLQCANWRKLTAALAAAEKGGGEEAKP